MKLSVLTGEYLTYLHVEQGVSPNTLRSYRPRLRRFLEWLEAEGYADDLASLNTPVLKLYLQHASTGGARPRTILGNFHPLRGLGEYAVAQGHLETNVVRALRLPKRDAPNRLLVSKEEVLALLAACERVYSPRRAAMYKAMLSCFVHCGLRRQELLDLKVGDLSGSKLVVVRGKGAKRRELYPPKECLEALRVWLTVRGACSHEAMWAVDKGRRAAVCTLDRMMDELKTIAGLAGQNNIKPHSLRHFFATNLAERGAGIKVVQAALGHSDPSTTFQYLHFASEPAKAMAQLASLEPPLEEGDTAGMPGGRDPGAGKARKTGGAGSGQSSNGNVALREHLLRRSGRTRIPSRG